MQGQTLMTPHELGVARRCAWIGAAIFGAGAIFAFVHVALEPYRGLTWGFSVANDLTVGVVWALAALAMAMQIGRLALFPVLGAWLAVTHGFLVAFALLWPGLPFIGASLVLVYLGSKAAPLFRSPPQRVSG